jgi:hypothetical protein
VICPLAVIPLGFVSVGYFTFREFIGLHSITKAFEPSCFIAFSKNLCGSFSLTGLRYFKRVGARSLNQTSEIDSP